MVDFFLRDGDEQRARGATFLDDIDMIPSREVMGPAGPAIVVVAQRSGAHVCWQCAELFNPSDSKLRGVEVSAGYVRILLHAKCVNGRPMSFRSFSDITRGLQARRFFTSATKAVDRARKAVMGG